jgi:hypothetical protein
MSAASRCISCKRFEQAAKIAVGLHSIRHVAGGQEKDMKIMNGKRHEQNQHEYKQDELQKGKKSDSPPNNDDLVIRQ